jgi:hypothetical protein
MFAGGVDVDSLAVLDFRSSCESGAPALLVYRVIKPFHRY